MSIVAWLKIGECRLTPCPLNPGKIKKCLAWFEATTDPLFFSKIFNFMKLYGMYFFTHGMEYLQCKGGKNNQIDPSSAFDFGT